MIRSIWSAVGAVFCACSPENAVDRDLPWLEFRQPASNMARGATSRLRILRAKPLNDPPGLTFVWTSPHTLT